MIPARKNPVVDAWFRSYTRSYLRRSFHRVLAAGPLPEKPSVPVLVCVSHTSWWDMLVGFWLCRDVLGWHGYTPMDQRQLLRYPILKRIGVFGVDRESLQGGREFLQYAGSLLRERPGGRATSLWITAQGEMVAPEQRPVRFYSGLAHLAEGAGECLVTTLAIDYAFWDERLPECFLSMAPLRRVEIAAGHRRPWLRDLERRMEQQLDHLAELKQSRDASRAHVLLQSRAAFSPAYAAIRRLTGGEAAREHGSQPTPPRWGPAGRRAAP